MLSFTGGLKVYLSLEPADMRKSFNGLASLAQDYLKEDPRDGALFLFTNKRRNLLKILFWVGTGLWVACKRLEQGRFSWPRPSQAGQRKLSLSPEELFVHRSGGSWKAGRHPVHDTRELPQTRARSLGVPA